jgi:hypothetical protein
MPSSTSQKPRSPSATAGDHGLIPAADDIDVQTVGPDTVAVHVWLAPRPKAPSARAVGDPTT